MVDTARARRLAKRIMTIVATELQHQVKDPRLAMVTITAATVTPDLRDATVYYTVYGDADEVAGTAAALASATGVLRSAVGAQTGVKFTPTLTFAIDTVPDTASHIDELLAAARRADAEVAERAAGASYAGEADPYKAPRPAEAPDGDEADIIDGEPDLADPDEPATTRTGSATATADGTDPTPPRGRPDGAMHSGASPGLDAAVER